MENITITNTNTDEHTNWEERLTKIFPSIEVQKIKDIYKSCNFDPGQTIDNVLIMRDEHKDNKRQRIDSGRK